MKNPSTRGRRRTILSDAFGNRIADPTPERIRAWIEHMSPDAGATTLILEQAGRGNTDYVQAGGGRRRVKDVEQFVVERRIYERTASGRARGGDRWDQVIAGRPVAERQRDTRIRSTPGYSFRCRSNEILMAADVLRIFVAFLSGPELAPGYSWRSIRREVERDVARRTKEFEELLEDFDEDSEPLEEGSASSLH